jgi:dihydroflavonol-4-reductase
MREFLEELAIIAGRKPPRFRMPHLVALGLAHAEAFVTGRILGRAPRIPLEGVRTAREIMFASSRRAVRELGLRQTPIREVLAKAVRWFEERARREQRGVS